MQDHLTDWIGLVALIRKRSAWGFSGWRSTPTKLVKSQVTHITWHYDSAAPRLKDTGDAMMRRTHTFHKVDRGWQGCGYGFLIDANGVIYEGRGTDYRGAHKPSGPGNNQTGIGVQLHLGGNESPTAAMKRAAVELTTYLNSWKGSTLRHTYHGDGFPTACPGPKVIAWVNAEGYLDGATAQVQKEDDVMSPAQEKKLDKAIEAIAALTKKVEYVQAQARTLGEQINYGREQNKTLSREHAELKQAIASVHNTAHAIEDAVGE